MILDDFHLWCLHCEDHIERKGHIRQEFNNLGVLDKVEFYYTTKGDWLSKVAESIPTIHTAYYNKYQINNPNIYGNVLSCLIGWYNIMKISLIRNYKYIMCFEDDIKFLINRQQLDNILLYLPKDFDIIKMYHSCELLYIKDGCAYVDYNLKEIPIYNNEVDNLFTKNKCVINNCWFIYSQKAIKKYIENINKYINIADRNINYTDDDLNWYYNNYQFCNMEKLRSSIN